MLLPSHGSNPHYLYEAMNIKMPEKYIDFSANLNPLGSPKRLKTEWMNAFSAITDYPDPEARVLTRQLAYKEKVPETSILVGNGGAELISLTANLLAGKRVLIIQPAFSEYAAACRAHGCEVKYHILKEPEWQLDIEQLRPDLVKTDAVFLCTPNNPTGICYREQEVLELIEACAKVNCMVIIDEAFYDFRPDAFSYSQYIHKYYHVIILRSMTKMFAIPGLRLGYAIADPGVTAQLRLRKPHWSVNGLAQFAGSLCLEEIIHEAETIAYVQKEKKRLNAFFEKHHFIVSASRVNFYLLRDATCEDASSLMTYLLKNGIIPRHTDNFPGLDGGWLRFAVKQRSDHDVLMEVLLRWRVHQSTL